MLDTSTRSPKLETLHGMRFLAALIVFSFHAAVEFTFSDPKTNMLFVWLTSGADSAVSFFFILSGFILTWTWRPGGEWRQFYLRRFARILPTHVVTFVAALILSASFGISLGLPQVLANLFLLQAWVPESSYLNTLNGPSWSLSVDAFCYLIFPLLFVVVLRIPRERLRLVLCASCLAVTATPLLAEMLPSTPAYGWDHAHSWLQMWFVWLFPVVRCGEMVVGILTARCLQTGQWFSIGERRGWVIVLVLGLVAYVLVLVGPWSSLYKYAATTVIPFVVIIGTVASIDYRAGVSRSRIRALCWWFGDISFTFYMVHYLILRFGHMAFGRVPSPYGGLTGPTWSSLLALGFLVAALLLSIGSAWVLSIGIERPFVRLVARRLRQAARF